MKKTLLLLSALLGAMFTPPVAAQTNLLENGDFETWTEGKPDNWTPASTAGNATLSQSTEAHEGSSSVCVKGTTKNRRLGYKELTLKAGTYHVAFYVKAANAGEQPTVTMGYVPVDASNKVGSYNYMSKEVEATDKDGNPTTKTEIDYRTVSDTWTLIEWDFTLEKTTKLCVVMMNSSKTGKDALVDDFSLTTEDGGISETEPEPTPDPEVVGLAGAKTLAQGDCVINLQNAVVTYVNGNNAYIEDATAGILVYLSGHGLVAGQSISGKVKATLTQYNGLYELTAFDTTEATVTEGATIPETVVTVAELKANPMKYESMRVKVVNVTANGAFSSRKATASQDGAELALYQKDTKAEFTFAEGDAINVVGYPGMFKTDFQLNVWEAADVTAYDPTAISTVTMQRGADQIYTIDGRRVQKLVKGLYIVNGKKVIVK